MRNILKYYACKYIGHDTYPGRAVDVHDVCNKISDIIAAILVLVWLAAILAALIINFGWALISIILAFIISLYLLIKLGNFLSKQYAKVKDITIYECRK